MRIPDRLLNRTLQVRRPHTTGDGGGGQVTTWQAAGTVRARLSQPTAVERETGDQYGADLTYPVYLLPEADVRRGDQLIDGERVLLVTEVYTPSEPVYLRADCRRRQSEEDA
ncbi:head-tail adaptor protein [Sphaerisporangium sp. NPDC004334]